MVYSHNATSSTTATTTKSCFSGILRRLLCTGSLPTHPSDSDHLLEYERPDHFINNIPPNKNEQEVLKSGGTATPGVVARLMGLESLPADMSWVPNKNYSLYNHLRSRSVNSADYLSPTLDLSTQDSYHHRRVRTSVSFREIPTTFIVCSDKNGDDHELKMMAKVAASDDQMKLKRNSSPSKNKSTTSASNKWCTKEKVAVTRNNKEIQENKKKKNVERRRVERNVLANNKSNDFYVKSKTKSKLKTVEQRADRRGAKKVEPKLHGCVDSCTDSVSVTSGNSGAGDFNSNRKNSTQAKVVDKYNDYPCVISVRKPNDATDHDNYDQQQLLKPIHITKSEKLLRKREVEFYVEKLVQVCRLTDEDTKLLPNNWPWISSSRVDQVIDQFEDYQDICFEFGTQIIEMLLQDVVDELC